MRRRLHTLKPQPRRRGSAYVIILVTATLATAMGLASFWAIRIQGRSSRVTDAAAQVRLLATCAVDRGMFEVNNNPNWRTDRTHDVWSDSESIGLGSIRFKFLDESDGSLNTGPAIPVRLVGRGEIGDSVKMYSVLLGTMGPNLLHNPGMEVQNEWNAQNASLQYDTTQKHSGVFSIWCNRSQPDSGLWQDVTTQISKGRLYYLEAWVHSSGSGMLDYSIILRENADHEASVVVPAGQWVRISGYVRPDWSTAPSSIRWTIRSKNHLRSLYVDDAVLREVQPSGDPLPGTWRSEIDP